MGRNKPRRSFKVRRRRGAGERSTLGVVCWRLSLPHSARDIARHRAPGTLWTCQENGRDCFFCFRC